MEQCDAISRAEFIWCLGYESGGYLLVHSIVMTDLGNGKNHLLQVEGFAIVMGIGGPALRQ